VQQGHQALVKGGDIFTFSREIYSIQKFAIKINRPSLCENLGQPPTPHKKKTKNENTTLKV